MKNNKKSGFTIVEAVIIVVVIGLLGLLGYVYYNKFIAKDNQAKTNSTAQTSSQATPSSVISAVQSKLAETYTVLPSPNTGSKVPSNDGTVYVDTSVNNAPAWQTKGYNFFASFRDGGAKTLSIVTHADSSGSADQAGVFAAVVAVYGSNNLTKYTDSYSGYDYYTNSQLVCSVSQVATMTGQTYASCATPDEYKQASEMLQPFYAALVKGDSTVDSTGPIRLTFGEEKDSSVSGYKNAWVSYGNVTKNTNYVGGAAALFYKVGNNDWQYFRSSQSVLACSDYNTQDLRNAYKGETCIDTSAGNVDSAVN